MSETETQITPDAKIESLDREIERLSTYHAAKENSAWIATLAYLTGAGAVFALEPSNANRGSLAVLAICMGGLTLIFIFAQLQRRITAASEIYRLLLEKSNIVKIDFSEPNAWDQFCKWSLVLTPLLAVAITIIALCLTFGSLWLCN